MSHVDRDLLALRALGEQLPAGEDEHVRACSECRSALAELSRTVEVGRSVTAEDRRLSPPPDRVWSAITDELAPSPASGSRVGPAEARARSRWQRSATWLVAAAAVVAVAVAGIVTLPIGDQGQVIAAADLERLEGVESGEARAELVTVNGERRLRVEVSGLPERSDSYYEVWLLAPDVSRLVSLGPIRGDGTYTIPEAIDPAQLSVVDISVEPTDGDPTHSGDSVLRGQLPLTT